MMNIFVVVVNSSGETHRSSEPRQTVHVYYIIYYIVLTLKKMYTDVKKNSLNVYVKVIVIHCY